jgi:hypothetical protein
MRPSRRAQAREVFTLRTDDSYGGALQRTLRARDPSRDPHYSINRPNGPGVVHRHLMPVARSMHTMHHRQLDRLPNISITVEWVPGHRKIQGNEIADRIAKRGSRLQPLDPNRSSYACTGAAWKRALRDMWKDRWSSTIRNRRADFTPADYLPPQTSPTKHFKELSRAALSRTFQARTGHAHIGSYYSRFVPTEPVECPCGEANQTRNHILIDCDRYERFQHLLGQHDED